MLERISTLCWGPWTLGLFLLMGSYFTVGSGFFQLRRFPLWVKTALFGLRKQSTPTGQGLSPLQSTATALAATIGTGSVAGVAAAITLGGAGAVFWMWASALVGMMTGCMEKTLSVLCRKKTPDGWSGGSMVWLETLGLHPLASLFSLCAITACLGMGSSVQSNSIAAGLESAFSIPTWVSGVVTAGLAGIVLAGGSQRVGALCERMVPLMAALFLSMGAVTLFLRRDAIPGALEEIFRCAFAPQSAAGGLFGSAIRCGCARGVFTNEAGLGTTAMIHAQSNAAHPAEEGMRGIFEVCFSTLVVCSVTALVLLTAPEDLFVPGRTGAALTSSAFQSALGRTGPALLSLCLTLFAFSSILGSYRYALAGLEHLGLMRLRTHFLPVFLLAVAGGAVADVTGIWYLADICSALMAWPTMIALLLFSPRLFRLLRAWES